MEEKYEFWLCQIKYIRLKTMCELHRLIGGAKALYEAKSEEVFATVLLNKREKEALKENHEGKRSRKIR